MPVHLFPAKVEALDETSPFLRVVRHEPNPEQFPFGFEEPLSEFFPVNGSSRQSRHSCYRKRQTTHDRQKAKRRMKCEYWSFLRSLSTSADLLESECKGMYWAARFSTMSLISLNGRFRACAASMSASTARGAGGQSLDLLRFISNG